MILLNETVFNSDNFTGLHTFELLLLQVKSQSAGDVQSQSWHVEVLDFAPLRGLHVRKLELSPSNLVNRIIKITHAHDLHVKMLDFAPFTICMSKNTYCLRDEFSQIILTNHLLL